MRYLSVANLEKFQHYRDRRPPWVKLHVSVLDDYEFTQLPDEARYHLFGMWILASSLDNKVPWDAGWVAQRIGATASVDLDALVDLGFLIEWTGDEQPSQWASRYIPEPVRREIFERDGNACLKCHSTDSLEIDHILPISRGGTSDKDNLQTLCRSCNRTKRLRRESYADAQGDLRMSRRPEAEAKKEKRQRPASAAKAASGEFDALFLEAWAVYPQRAGSSKIASWKAWLKRMGEGVDPVEMLTGAKNYAEHVKVNPPSESRFLLQAQTFFGPGRRFADDWRIVTFDHSRPLVDEFGCLTPYGELVTRPK